MIVELGKRVDDKICETYLRNWEVGADSGVTSFWDISATKLDIRSMS